MSVIDNRIVEMVFDNSRFNKNVESSMESIDQINKKIDGLENNTTGLSNLSKAFENIDISALNGALDKVSNGFSALEIMGITAIQHITDKIINMGEELAKSLSVEQIQAGWQKFEDKTSSVQTMMMNIEDAEVPAEYGSKMEYVNTQLDKLNKFTDETSYNFTDMTSNIGKFISQGVDLETAATSMEGIAAWAALAGQNAQTASRAMYNISQAMGVGYMGTIDWKSIQNANMATKEFKENVIDLALEEGTLIQVLDESTGDMITYSKKSYEAAMKQKDVAKKEKALADAVVSATNFGGLADRWFTSDILLEAMDTYGAFSAAIIEDSEAMGISVTDLRDYTDEYIAGTLDLSQAAADTGVDLETLRKSLDRLSWDAEDREKAITDYSTQFGISEDELKKYARGYKEVAGDFDEANKYVSEIALQTGADVGVLTEAMKQLIQPTMDVGRKAFKAAQEAKTFTEAVEATKDAVSTEWLNIFESIFGDYEAQKVLWTDLAGYLWDIFAGPLDVINDILEKWQELGGQSLLFTPTDANDPEKQLGAFQQFGDILSGLVSPITDAYMAIFHPDADFDSVHGLNELAKKLIEVTKSFRDWATSAKETILKRGPQMQELFESLFKLVKSLGNVFQVITKPIKTVSGIFKTFIDDMFGADVIGDVSGWIETLADKISSLTIFEKIGYTISDMLFAITDGGFGLVQAFRGVNGEFDLFGGIVTIIGNALKSIVILFGGLCNVVGIKLPDSFQNAFDKIDKFVELLQEFPSKIKGFLENAFFEDELDPISGEAIGRVFKFAAAWETLKTSIGKVVEFLKEKFQSLKETISSVFGKAGDEVEAFDAKTASSKAFGIIEKALDGIKKALEFIWEVGKLVFKEIGDGLSRAFGDVSGSGEAFGLDSLMDILSTGGLIGLVTILAKTFSNFNKTLGEVFATIKSGSGGGGGIFGSLTDFFDKFAGGGLTTQVKSIATSVVMLAASLVVLSMVDSQKIWNSGLALAGMVEGVLQAVRQLDSFGIDKTTNKTVKSLETVAISVILLSVAAKILAGVDQNSLASATVAVEAFIGGLTLAMNKMPKDTRATDGLIKLAAAILILSETTKIFAKLSLVELGKGLGAVAVGVGIMVGALNLMPKNASKSSSGFVSMAASLWILSFAVKSFSGLSIEELAKGLISVAVAAGIMVGALNLIPKDAAVKAAGMVILAAALDMVAVAIMVLSKFDMAALGGSLLILVGAMFSMALVCTLMSGALPGAAAMLVLAVALNALVVPIMLLQTLNILAVAGGLLALVAVIGVLAVGAVILSAIAVPMLIFAGVLLVFGAALLTISASLLIFQLVFTGGVTTIVLGFAALLSTVVILAPLIAEAIVSVIVAIVTAIAENAPIILDQLMSLLLSTLDLILEYTPQIIEKAVAILLMLLDALIEYIPQIVEKVVELFVEILGCIGDQVEPIVSAGIGLIVDFLNGLARAIDENIDLVLDAAINLVWAIIKAMLSVFTHGIPQFVSMGADVLSGLISGFIDNIHNAVEKVKEGCKKIWTAVHDFFKIGSPSKVMADLGQWLPEGLAVGIEKNGDAPVKAMEGVSDDTVGIMQDALKSVTDVGMFGDMNPTITPVLDLSEFENGIGDMNSMFDANSIGSIDVGADISSVDMSNLLDGMGGMGIDATGLDMSDYMGNVNLANESAINSGSQMEAMSNELAELRSYVKNMKIVLDSGEMVGGLVNRMDRALGQKAVYAGRGI